MQNKNSTAGKSKILTFPNKPKHDEGDGILKIKCPVCSKSFRYRRGREKSPDAKVVSDYLKKAQCPYCGQPLRFSLK